MGDIVPERIIRVPLKAIEKPRRGLCEVMVNSWWVYDPATDSVIFYRRHKPQYSSPQCHTNKAIAERVLLLQVWAGFGFDLRQIPVAFVPIWMTGDVDFGYQLRPLLAPENVLDEL